MALDGHTLDEIALEDALQLWQISFAEEAPAGPDAAEPAPFKSFYETEGKARGQQPLNPDNH